MKQLKPAVGMTRISDEHRQGDGYSPQLQLQRIHEQSEQMGFKIEKLFQIEETAFKPLERRQFAEVKDYIESHKRIVALVVDRLDRFARNYTDLGWAMETARNGVGIEVFALDQRISTLNEPTHFAMYMTGANDFSQRLKDRALTDMPRLAAQGRWLWKAPHGYRNVPKVVAPGNRALIEIDENYEWVIKSFFQKYAYQCFTVPDLIAWTKEKNIKTRSGKTFAKDTIYTLLRNRIYLGEVRWRDEWFPGQHEPIIDRKTFNKVQEIMNERAGRNLGLKRGNMPFLLKDLNMVCGYCGSAITAQVTKGNGGRYVYYYCYRKNTPECRKTYNENDLLQRGGAVFAPIKFPPEVMAQFEVDFDKGVKVVLGEAYQTQAFLKRQVSQIQAKIEKAMNMALDAPQGASAEWNQKIVDLHQEKLKLEQQVEEANALDKGKVVEVMDFIFWANNLQKSYEEESNGLMKAKMLKMVSSNLTLTHENIEPDYRNHFLEAINFDSSRGVVGPAGFEPATRRL